MDIQGVTNKSRKRQNIALTLWRNIVYYLYIAAHGRQDAMPAAEADKKPRGWHAKMKPAPHAGKGTATVEPVRSRKGIEAIKAELSDKPRDLALFVFGISSGYRAKDLIEL